MPIDQWWNFFYLCGSASVTLTGLTFVAVTLGVTIIKKENMDKVNVFFSPICFHFLHVFFLCCLTAIPGASPELLAAGAILSALWRLASMPRAFSVVHGLAQKDSADIDHSDWVTIVLIPTAVYAGLIASGVAFLLGKPWAVDVLAISCLVLLLASAKGAWDTVLWVAASVR
jgi:hypothetical protein